MKYINSILDLEIDDSKAKLGQYKFVKKTSVESWRFFVKAKTKWFTNALINKETNMYLLIVQLLKQKTIFHSYGYKKEQIKSYLKLCGNLLK